MVKTDKTKPSAYVAGLPIWVYDNFLAPYEHEDVAAYCQKSLYNIDHISNIYGEYPAHRLAALLTDEQIRSHLLTAKFIQVAEEICADVHIERAYINAANSATITTEHIDDVVSGLTMLYYPNMYWKTAFGGETLFFNEDMEIAFASVFKPNRAIFFDPRIRHTARPPTVIADQMRYTFVYKGVQNDAEAA